MRCTSRLHSSCWGDSRHLDPLLPLMSCLHRRMPPPNQDLGKTLAAVLVSPAQLGSGTSHALLAPAGLRPSPTTTQNSSLRVRLTFSPTKAQATSSPRRCAIASKREAWLSLLPTDPRPALLASKKPFARFVAMTAVLGMSDDDTGVRRTRKAVVADAGVRALVDHLPLWESGFAFGGHNSSQDAAWHCFPHPVVRISVAKWRGPGRKNDACLQITVEALRLFARVDASKRPEGLAAAARTLLGCTGFLHHPSLTLSLDIRTMRSIVSCGSRGFGTLPAFDFLFHSRRNPSPCQRRTVSGLSQAESPRASAASCWRRRRFSATSSSLDRKASSMSPETSGSGRMASVAVLFAHAASLQATARALAFRTSSDTHPISTTPGRIASPCVWRFLQSC